MPIGGVHGDGRGARGGIGGRSSWRTSRDDNGARCPWPGRVPDAQRSPCPAAAGRKTQADLPRGRGHAGVATGRRDTGGRCREEDLGRFAGRRDTGTSAAGRKTRADSPGGGHGDAGDATGRRGAAARAPLL